MRQLVNAFILTGTPDERRGVITSRQCSDVTVAPHLSSEIPVALTPRPSAVRVVGLIALFQSLLFLAILFFVCRTAGAAPVKKLDFNSDLQFSSYDSKATRDPFSRFAAISPDAKLVPGMPIAFQLDGILYQSSKPSAVVNGQLITLDKTVTLTAGNGAVKVRAVEITRDKVVLQAGTERVELRLNAQTPPTRP